jgi:thymidine kinase
MSCGSLTVIHGPMFAGKTSTLLMKLGAACATQGGDKCLLISSNKDHRPELNQSGILSTHSAVISTKTSNEIKINKLSEADTKGIEVIAIDEAQFFERLKEYILKWIKEGKDVYISGLTLTSEGAIFGEILSIIPFADKIYRLEAICSLCIKEGGHKKPAILTKCIETKTCDVMIGANKYIPLCLNHWLV